MILVTPNYFVIFHQTLIEEALVGAMKLFQHTLWERILKHSAWAKPRLSLRFANVLAATFCTSAGEHLCKCTMWPLYSDIYEL